MDDKIKSELVKILKHELKPAIGVTEPVSVALSAAESYRSAGGGELEKIKVRVDPALFKNGVSCIVPGTDVAGFEMAAIIGALCGDPSLGMQVLKNITANDVSEAKRILKDNIVDVKVTKENNGLYVETEIETSNGRGKSIIQGEHDNFVFVESNGKTTLDKEKKSTNQGFEISKLMVGDLIDFVQDVDFDSIAFVLDALAVNDKLAQEGLTGKWGLRVGHVMAEAIADKEDLSMLSQIYVSAATDARLGGAKVPAMSVAGSGTHGITATLPIASLSKIQKIEDDKLARALALSFLITIYIKKYTGRLSAFCGCAATAGAGASAGLVYLLGGNKQQICNAIINMSADVTGIICDGANLGCALKTSTGAASAVKAAVLALNGAVMPDNSGIVGRSVEKTIENMGKVCFIGMGKTDEVIIDIIENR